MALAAGALPAGCYNTTGRSGANVGDIYIPFFQDQTTGERAVNLGTRVTELVVEEFERDRAIRVYRAEADRGLAQKELTGTVRRFQETVQTRDPNQQGEEYRVVIICQVAYKDLEEDKIIWQDSNVFGDGNYKIEEGDAGFSRAVTESLDKILDKIVDKTIKAW